MTKYYDISKLKDLNGKLCHFILQRRNNGIIIELRRNKMTRQDKINYIIDYFNAHFKWQKLFEGWEIDKSKLEKSSDKELDDLIEYIK